MGLPSVRENVRNAIVEYLSGLIQPGVKPQNQTIPYLAQVYGFPAKVTNMGDLGLNVGVGGAGIWLYFAEEIDKRYELAANYATTGATGKAVEFNVRLICLLRSSEETAQDVGAAGEAFLDGLLNAIRQDPNAGTGENGTGSGAIWSWGLGSFPNGGPDLRAEQSLPRPVRQGVTDIQTIVEVTVVSLIDPQI